jgi:benzodiazapine receptor
MEWTKRIEQEINFEQRERRRPGWLALVVALAIPLTVGGLSSLATRQAIPTWYRELRKPAWSPPRWLFAPVWTLLYLAMGVASWRIWRRGAQTGLTERLWRRDRNSQVRGALALYGLQLVLNGAWSLIFFGGRRIDLALGEIALLWATILATLVRFYQIDPVAGWLLVPYQAWVSFASLLNATIWRLNR